MRPSLEQIRAERFRRGPRLDDSPEALERVARLMIDTGCVAPDVARLLRAGGVEVPDDVVDDGEPDNDASYRLEDGGE